MITLHNLRFQLNAPRGATSDSDRRYAVGQTKLGIDASGTIDRVTEAAMRQFQSDNGLVADGIVGPRTFATLDG